MDNKNKDSDNNLSGGLYGAQPNMIMPKHTKTVKKDDHKSKSGVVPSKIKQGLIEENKKVDPVVLSSLKSDVNRVLDDEGVVEQENLGVPEKAKAVVKSETETEVEVKAEAEAEEIAQDDSFEAKEDITTKKSVDETMPKYEDFLHNKEEKKEDDDAEIKPELVDETMPKYEDFPHNIVEDDIKEKKTEDDDAEIKPEQVDNKEQSKLEKEEQSLLEDVLFQDIPDIESDLVDELDKVEDIDGLDKVEDTDAVGKEVIDTVDDVVDEVVDEEELKEEILRIENEQATLGIELSEIKNELKTTSENARRMSGEVDQIMEILDPVLEKEQSLQQEIKQVEAKEAIMNSAEETHLVETERWKLEDQLKSAEQEKWKISEGLSKIKQQLSEGVEGVKAFTARKDGIEERIDELSREKERKELSIELREVVLSKTQKEEGLGELIDKVKKADGVVTSVKSQEESITEKQRELEIQEHTTDLLSEQKKIEEKKHEMQEKRRGIEKERYAKEKERDELSAELDKLQNELNGFIGREENLKARIDKLK